MTFGDFRAAGTYSELVYATFVSWCFEMNVSLDNERGWPIAWSAFEKGMHTRPDLRKGVQE